MNEQQPIFACRDLKIEARPHGKDPIPIVKGVTFDVNPGQVVRLWQNNDILGVAWLHETGPLLFWGRRPSEGR